MRSLKASLALTIVALALFSLAGVTTQYADDCFVKLLEPEQVRTCILDARSQVDAVADAAADATAEKKQECIKRCDAEPCAASADLCFARRETTLYLQMLYQ